MDPWLFSPPVLGAEGPQRVQWCAVGPDERSKCDNWSAVSGGALRCTSEETVEDCIAAIAVRGPCLYSWARTPRHVALLLSLPRYLPIRFKADMQLLRAAPHLLPHRLQLRPEQKQRASPSHNLL